MSDHRYEEDAEDLTQVRNIIKQLNEKPAQERKREVVTRPDGTKVIRVTKRRKRMLTEMDKQKRGRKSFMLGLLCLFLISCAMVGVFMWRMAVMSSEGYLAEKQEELREIWGATHLTITGAGLDRNILHADVIEAEFPETSMVKRVRITDVEAKLSTLSFLSSKMEAELVKIANIDMQLNSAAKHLQMPKAQKESFWEFHRVECNNFSLSFADSDSAPLSIRNTKAYMYYPRANKAISVVILNEGVFNMRGWQNIHINNAKITISPNAVEDILLQGTTNTGENVAEEVRTSIGFYGKIMNGAELAGPYMMDSNNIPLADFTDARFDYFFSGNTSTSVRGKKHAKASVILPFVQSSPVFSGEMTLDNVCITGFPVLMQMIEHIEPAKRRAYMPVKMNRAVVKISHQEDGVQLEIPDSGMVERDLLNVRGTMKVDKSNNLSGKLEYAMPSILTRVEYPDGVSDPLFREMGEWAWIYTTLRGKANHPDDNFSELELRAAEARKSRPARVPFSQIDLDRMLEDMNKEEDNTFIEKPLEIGPSQNGNSGNPFESSNDPFAQ